MSFDLELKAVAIAQAAKEYAYYERVSPGPGERFIAALVEGYGTLRQNPFFQVRKTPYRYLKLPKFPHRLIYEVQGQSVIVYQLRHTRRKSHRKYGP
ncbi:MAG: type II toxin-antitoxin system RelE/ParE family toxin [Flavobacteriales bacterium]|nr:type II toxin-antitoxin system RelE/ParE family toxin [Flavobacteriales bacterium]